MGGELVLKADTAYPIATYATLERDPLEALLVTLSGLGNLVRRCNYGAPASPNWLAAVKLTTKLRRGRNSGSELGRPIWQGRLKAPSANVQEVPKGGTNPIESVGAGYD